ncbi:MAG TPA: hypothetical protein VMD25_12585 [Acidobacteriaceae bacterium]|nr:hypothetical protein [Acidobacteriaceae bacterium]
MNQYLFLRRMRGPILLLIFAVTAVLAEYTSIGYDKSWPLYIIALGLLKLAENAVLAQNPPPVPPPYPGYPAQAGYPGYPRAGTPPGPTTTSTAIVPSPGEDRS